jgi:hypothetical protein
MEKQERELIQNELVSECFKCKSTFYKGDSIFYDKDFNVICRKCKQEKELIQNEKFWSLRGVVGTGLNQIMPEEDARWLQQIFYYKTAYLVSSTDGVTWTQA